MLFVSSFLFLYIDLGRPKSGAPIYYFLLEFALFQNLLIIYLFAYVHEEPNKVQRHILYILRNGVCLLNM